MSCVSTRQMSWLSLRLNRKICPAFRANTKEAAFGRLHKGGGGLWLPPFVVSFELALNIGHILVLWRKTCASLRAKTSALLRHKTGAVLRVGTCAWFSANSKEAAFGRLHKGERPLAVPLFGFLCIGSEQSTCPSSQHNTCRAFQQGRCIGSQQGTCLASQQ